MCDTITHMEHGTNSMYSNGGCRCNDCRNARARYDRERRARVRDGKTNHEHGIAATYKIGCRCDPCKEAHRVWVAEYRERRLAAEDIVHGTVSGYQVFKCRCDDCVDVMKPHARANWLKKNYGLSIEDWAQMWSEQDGKCASCGDAFPEIKSAHVDHNHTNGEVRALLCKWCNVSLGFLKEDPERIQRLAEYAKKYWQE